DVEEEVAAIRERMARLETAERPAQEGDFVVVDYAGTLVADGDTEAAAGGAIEGGEGRDQLIELGSNRLIPGFEQALVGASAGETRTTRLRFPEDYGNRELAGREASFEVTV